MSDSYMKKIPVAKIALGDRARQDYGDINELQEDLKENGQIQPIAVFEGLAPWLEGKKNTEGKEYTLIGGARRLLAAAQLGWIEIDAKVFTGEISKYRLNVLELSENLKRKDFSFDEELALKKKIHELFIERYGKKESPKSGDPDEVGWSKRDTAKFLNESPGGLSEELALADALEKIPELKKAKNKSEAKRMFQQLQEDILTKELQKRLEEGKAKTTIPEDRRKELLDAYILGDTYELFAQVPEKSADIIVCDPPYGIDLASIRKEDRTVDLKIGSSEEYTEYITKILQLCHRALKDDRWLILWFGIQWVSETLKALKDVGFKLGPVPFGWWTKNNGRTHFPDRYLANRVDAFIYASKGEARIHKTNHNIFDYAVQSKSRFHKTEKPVALCREILHTFAEPTQLLIVPFLGSGNDLIAGHQLGLQGFGFEIEPKYKSRYTYNLYGQHLLDLEPEEASRLEEEVGDEAGGEE